MSQSRGMFMGFAGILTVGFALSGWYVGQRILAAEARAAVAPAPIAAPQQSLPAAPINSPEAAAPQAEPSGPPPDDGTDIYGSPSGTIP